MVPPRRTSIDVHSHRRRCCRIGDVESYTTSHYREHCSRTRKRMVLRRGCFEVSQAFPSRGARCRGLVFSRVRFVVAARPVRTQRPGSSRRRIERSRGSTASICISRKHYAVLERRTSPLANTIRRCSRRRSRAQRPDCGRFDGMAGAVDARSG